MLKFSILIQVAMYYNKIVYYVISCLNIKFCYMLGGGKNR